MKVGQALLVFSIKESTTALNEFETVDLKKKVQVLGRACDTIVKWEATSVCLRFETTLASVVILTDNFQSYNEVVETISQVHLGEGGSGDVTDRRRRVESRFQDIGWKRFEFVGVLACSNIWYHEKCLEGASDFQILAVKKSNRNPQDQILGCSLVKTNV